MVTGGATATFLFAPAAMMFVIPVLLANANTAIIGLLWGAAAFAIVPPIQTRVMQAARDAPAPASSINIGGFNLGNALGAAVRGSMIKGSPSDQLTEYTLTPLVVVTAIRSPSGAISRDREAPGT